MKRGILNSWSDLLDKKIIWKESIDPSLGPGSFKAELGWRRMEYIQSKVMKELTEKADRELADYFSRLKNVDLYNPSLDTATSSNPLVKQLLEEAARKPQQQQSQGGH